MGNCSPSKGKKVTWIFLSPSSGRMRGGSHPKVMSPQNQPPGSTWIPDSYSGTAGTLSPNWCRPDPENPLRPHSSRWHTVGGLKPLPLPTPETWFFWPPEPQEVAPSQPERKVLTLQKTAHKFQSLGHWSLQDLLPLISAKARKRTSVRTRVLGQPSLLATTLPITFPSLQAGSVLDLTEKQATRWKQEKRQRHHLPRRNCVVAEKWGLEA